MGLGPRGAAQAGPAGSRRGARAGKQDLLGTLLPPEVHKSFTHVFYPRVKKLGDGRGWGVEAFLANPPLGH